MSFDSIKREFINPGNVFRFAPFWFLNHDLNETEIRWQVREMHKQGVGGFIMHPRHGLLTPYMSDEFLDMIAAAVDEGRKLGMKAYLYDENNWPSGPADAEVFVGHPEFRMSGVEISDRFEVSGAQSAVRDLQLADEFVAAVAVPLENGEPAGFPESAVNLADFVCSGRLEWTPPQGQWRVYAFSRRWYKGYFFGSYLDTLNRDAVRRFIELAHEKYVERLGAECGTTIQGIFTDEPNMNANPAQDIAWTPSLPGAFEWHKHYDLIRVLPALFEQMGPLTTKIRCDFYDVVTELYTTAYFKQIGEYSEQHRLALMGHVNDEGELIAHTRAQGDFFRGAQYMTWSGCDLLCEITWPTTGSEFGLNNLAGPKFASSAAHLLGKRIVGCECYGLASQWSIDLRNLKWLADWQACLGINLMEPHAFYYSIGGFRKWECPPGEFYQSAFWPYYSHLADYVGRLCSLFTDGRHQADVAFFYPIKSMWAAMSPHATPEAVQMTASFNHLGSLLLKLNFDFDVVSEEMLQQADITGGAIGVKRPDGTLAERFKILAMPAVTTISVKTARKLLEYVQAGGRIVAIGELPSRSIEGTADEEVIAIFRQIFGADYDASFSVAAASAPVISEQELEGWSGGLLVGAPTEAAEEGVLGPLNEALNSAVKPDVAVIADGKPVADVVHLHYVHDDTHFFMLSNSSRERAYDCEVRLAVCGEVSIWDAETGNMNPAPVAVGAPTGVAIPLSLHPTQSVVLCVEPAKLAPSTLIIGSELPVVEFGPARATSLTPRAGRFSLTVGGGDGEPKTITVSSGPVPAPVVLDDKWEFVTDKPNVLPLTHWNYEMVNGVERRDWTSNCRRFTAQFDAQIIPTQARLLLDGLAGEKVWERSADIMYSVSINGTKLAGLEPGCYLDHYIYETSLEGLLKAGRNEITVETQGALYEPGALRHPVMIVGRFALAGRSMPRLVAEASTVNSKGWEKQGYPYYAGSAVYRQNFRLTPSQLACDLFVDSERPRDMAEVIVNGKSCGARCWEPWRWDITAVAKSGNNTLEIRVANAMQGLFTQQPIASGLVGKVSITPYKRVVFAW